MRLKHIKWSIYVNSPCSSHTALQERMPGADFKLQLSSTDNVVGEVMYPAVPLLEESTALMLMEAYKIFDEAGYTIKIYDAYRPASAQDKLEATVDFAGNNDLHSLGRAESEEIFREKYASQVLIYKKALSMSTGYNVKETLLYSFHLGKEIKVES